MKILRMLFLTIVFVNYCISYRAILVTILADSVIKEFVKFENKGFLQIYSAKKQAGANISL